MSTESTAKVMIVDDHPIFCAGLRAILSGEPEVTVCGEAGSVDAALGLLEECDPDLILLDLSLPGKNGIELLRALGSFEKDYAVLVLSSHDPLLYAQRCLAEGARGYLEKEDAPDLVLDAIRTVLSGEVYLSPRLAAQVVGNLAKTGRQAPLSSLSDRELNVLELLGRGERPKDIAEHLGISSKTVDAHLTNIRHKLGLRDARELLRSATAWAEGGFRLPER